MAVFSSRRWVGFCGLLIGVSTWHAHAAGDTLGEARRPSCPVGYKDRTHGAAYWWRCHLSSSCPGSEPWTTNQCACACVTPQEYDMIMEENARNGITFQPPTTTPRTTTKETTTPPPPPPFLGAQTAISTSVLASGTGASAAAANNAGNNAPGLGPSSATSATSGLGGEGGIIHAKPELPQETNASNGDSGNGVSTVATVLLIALSCILLCGCAIGIAIHSRLHKANREVAAVEDALYAGEIDIESVPEHIRNTLAMAEQKHMGWSSPRPSQESTANPSNTPRSARSAGSQRSARSNNSRRSASSNRSSAQYASAQYASQSPQVPGEIRSPRYSSCSSDSVVVVAPERTPKEQQSRQHLRRAANPTEQVPPLSLVRLRGEANTSMTTLTSYRSSSARESLTLKPQPVSVDRRRSASTSPRTPARQSGRAANKDIDIDMRDLILAGVSRDGGRYNIARTMSGPTRQSQTTASPRRTTPAQIQASPRTSVLKVPTPR